MYLAQYGNILAPSTEVAKQRGSGNWNPPPIWQQSTDRGHAWKNAYNLYNNEQTKSSPFYEPSNKKEYINFNTIGEIGDDLRKNVFEVGSTGLYLQNENSWNDKYTEWALRSMQLTPNSLLVFFFSKDNIEYLQQRTVNEIKKHTNKIISPQSIDELLIIMRSKYIYALSGWLPQQNNPNIPQNRGPAPCSLQERLSRLNASVLEETVKQTLSGIKQYEQYIKDTSSLPMPLSIPVFTSMKGSRELSESIGFNSGHEQTLAANSFNQRYNII